MGTQPYCFMSKIYQTDQRSSLYSGILSGTYRHTGERRSTDPEMVSCDIVGLGRSLLADPDYVKKLEAGGEGRRIRHCMMCNRGCTDAIQNRKFLNCVLNAENGYEYERTITPSDEKKKVVVIGGGVAGMEAASVASIKVMRLFCLKKKRHLAVSSTIASIHSEKI